MTVFRHGPVSPWLALAAALAAALASGCQTAGSGAAESAGAIEGTTHSNPYDRVAWREDGAWRVTPPPELRATGRTMAGPSLLREAQIAMPGLRLDADVGFADARFAQLEARSALELLLWCKRFLRDIGYRYRPGVSDCEDYARLMRSAATLFAERGFEGAGAAVFAVYATMERGFAGVGASEGNHALLAVWTDEGGLMVEPQGLDATVVGIERWTNPVYRGDSD